MSMTTTKHALDIKRIRAEFPILERELNSGHRVIYLDSAATAQKPKVVINRMSSYYELQNANIHRGIHTLAEEATAAYESPGHGLQTLLMHPLHVS